MSTSKKQDQAAANRHNNDRRYYYADGQAVAQGQQFFAVPRNYVRQNGAGLSIRIAAVEPQNGMN